MKFKISVDALSLTFELEAPERAQYLQSGGTLLFEKERGDFAGELIYLASLLKVPVSVVPQPNGVTVEVENTKDSMILLRPFTDLITDGVDLR